MRFGLVAARIPKTGRNDYRENHENQHFLFARVAYREEFCSKFAKECTFYACDDMAKFRMGPVPAVSRSKNIVFLRQTTLPIYRIMIPQILGIFCVVQVINSW